MEVGKKTILNQFIGGNNSTQFVIPIYQRNYVWEKKNVEQLLNDIERMIPFINDESVFHFFGSVVYIDTLHKGSFSEWTIIDGQQRLTTIFLLLQALKNIYPESFKVISKKYLLNDEDIINTDNELDRYRLKPLVSDDNVYVKIANNEFDDMTLEEKGSNVFKAYTTIKSKLNEWKDKYDIDTILTALDKFRIVWIQLGKNENPQQVFESINSTGVNLTAADLIRNFVLMNKDDETQTRLYNDYWKNIEFKYVDTKNLKEFFRYYVSIKERNTIADREVYEKFKNEYKKLLENMTEDEILNNILNYAKYYYFIKDNNNDIEIETALQDYRNSKSNMPNIILMETMNLYFEENRITKKDLINTINLLTSYNVRRNIAGEESKSISNMFGNLLGRIYKYFDEDNMSYYDCVVRALVNDTRLTSQHMPTDKQIYDEFEKSNLYSRDSVSFILKKIENNESRIPYSQLNIEHVMPQTATSFWETKVSDKDNYDEIVNRIGNLTLVDSKDNSSMGNNNFASKKKTLEKSRHIKMNEYILDKNDWNEEEINTRSEKLAKAFISIFKYPDFDIVDTNSHINLTTDDIDAYNEDLKNSVPLEIVINDEHNSNVSSWNDVQLEILKYLYNSDSVNFLEAVENINLSNSGISNKISTDASSFRAPLEFTDGIYCEVNTNTKYKCLLIQGLLKAMNRTDDVIVTYTKRKDDLD